MDTLTHTLCGWLLSRAGLERFGPWVPAVAMISANFPDAEQLIHPFASKAEYLQNHRGFSHSLIGAAGLTLVAAFCVWGIGQCLRKRIHHPPKFLWAVLICGIGILSHLFLDGLNTYGLRIFLPWSETRHYGDIAFIIDPWMWMILGSAIFIGSRKSRLIRNVFLFLTASTTAIMFQAARMEVISGTVVCVWLALLLLCFLIHVRVVGSQRPATPARWGLLIWSIYLSGLLIGNRMSLSRAYEALQDSKPALPGQKISWQMSANPVPAVPWCFEVVAYSEKSIELFSVDLKNGSVERYPTINPRLDHPALPSLMETPEYKAWRSFARFPMVRETRSGIVLCDMRYRVYMESHRFGNNDFSQWSELTVPLLNKALLPRD